MVTTEKTKIRKNKNETTNDKTQKGFMKWWKQYYVYVVSSLFIIAVVTTVFVLEQYWPLGDNILLDGDFLLQGLPFSVELKSKLLSGESLNYTWNAGFGTNFYSILSYGMVNPSTFVFMLIPKQYILHASAILFVINLLCMNGSMLYFLSHRPKCRLAQNDITNMLFSLAYTLCIYVVSNVESWTFLIVAAIFPLIILGLEEYVANKDWKLYFIALSLSIIINYYFTGLFCIFIILYYLTLEFGDFRVFLNKSLKIMGISIGAIGVSAVFLIPTALQMMKQDYVTSAMTDTVWFTTIYDILKNFFAFNISIETGSRADSYGEVNLYYGLLPLMLMSFYFLNAKIKRSVRLKKLLVVVIYMVAFNLNALNYAMHLFHYPSWYPNRFSLFFTLYCLILAYEFWVTMKETEFKYMTVLRGGILGVFWVVITVVCFAFATEVGYQFTYYFSIMIFLFYMVAMLLLPYLKGKEARILAIIGCIEIGLSFTYSMILRKESPSISEFSRRATETEEFLIEADIEDANNFSRVLEAKEVMTQNGGMYFGMKTTSMFASSMGNIVYFLANVGVTTSGNTIWTYEYSPVTMSLLNVQYILRDSEVTNYSSSKYLYPGTKNIYDNYSVYYEKDNLCLYENPTVLSVGYMIDEDAENTFGEEVVQFEELGIDCIGNINRWVEDACGVTDVMNPMEFVPTSIDSYNCIAAIKDDNFLVMKENLDIINLEEEGIQVSNYEEEYNPSIEGYATLTYVAETEGEYYVRIGNVMMATGYLEKGEEGNICFRVSDQMYGNEVAIATNVELYRLDAEKWQQAYDILSQQQLQVSTYDSDTIEGTIDVQEDGIFFTSIPYDENWHLYVDGEEVEVLPLWNKSFVAAKLTAGEHEIRLEYKQRGLTAGVLVSVGILALAVTYWIVVKKKNKRDYLLEEEKLYGGLNLEICYSEEELEARKNRKKKAEQATSSVNEESTVEELELEKETVNATNNMDTEDSIGN